jgi:uncharacterized membrane protein
MTQEEGDRRLMAYYGFALIFLGLLLVFVSFNRGDDNWDSIILAGVSFAVAAGMLAFAFRPQRG